MKVTGWPSNADTSESETLTSLQNWTHHETKLEDTFMVEPISIVTALSALAEYGPKTLKLGRETLELLTRAPSAADKNEIIAYVRYLDQRRVFSATYNVEVFESCIASLSSFKAKSEDVLVSIKHPIAVSAIEQIIHDIRTFLDKWQIASTWRPYGDFGRFPDFDGGSGRHPLGHASSEAQFFSDLGELRGCVRGAVQVLGMVVPKAVAPTLAKLFSP